MKELLQKIPFGILLTLYIAYLGYDYYWFTTNSDSPLTQKLAQIETIKKENLRLQAEVKKANEFYENLNNQKGQLRNFAARLDEMKATLSEDLDVPSFVKMVITEAKKVGVTVLSLRPTKTASEEFFAENAFELKFKAVYVQLIVFLERLGNIQKIVRVDNFSLHPVTNTNNSRYVELEGVIEIKAYRYLASKADQIGRAEASVAAPGAVPSPAASPGRGGAQ